MKLKWTETYTGARETQPLNGVHVTVAKSGYHEWVWHVACAANDCPISSGSFRVKDLEAAKLEAVERALKWTKRLAYKLESVG